MSWSHASALLLLFAYQSRFLPLAIGSLPYGPIVILPATLAFLAATLTYAFGLGCGMISFNWGTSITYFGPWTAELVELEGADFDNTTDTATVYYSTACYTYNNFAAGPTIKGEFDAPAKTAQAFSMIALVLAIPLAVVACLPCCMVLSQARKIYKITAFVCIFAMFSSFMTLVRTCVRNEFLVQRSVTQVDHI